MATAYPPPSGMCLAQADEESQPSMDHGLPKSRLVGSTFRLASTPPSIARALGPAPYALGFTLSAVQVELRSAPFGVVYPLGQVPLGLI